MQGCDASVLLNSTEGNLAERDAKPNKSLRGFSSVDRVKAKLEAACSNTVSCADVLTLMARDAVVLAKGPFWPVALGRRDGSVSSATEAADQLPPANGDVPLLAKIFASKGLDLKDLVVLSGAHTLGTAHCPSYADRLYNFSSAYSADPTLDSEYADRLRTRCKSVDDQAMLSEMDPGSYKTFDTATTAMSPSAGGSSSPTPRSSPTPPPGSTSSASPPASSTTCSSRTSASPWSRWEASASSPVLRARSGRSATSSTRLASC